MNLNSDYDTKLGTKKVLLVLRSPFFLKNFDEIILGLNGKGIVVDILFSSRKFTLQEAALINRIRDKGYKGRFLFHPVLNNNSAMRTLSLLTIIDALRFFNVRYDDTPKLRARGLAKLNEFNINLRFLLKFSKIRNSEKFYLNLAKLSQSIYLIKCPVQIRNIVEKYDAVLISPNTPIGSEQVFYGSAAIQLKKPFFYLLYSWDNLTNKGFIKPFPTHALVWNNLQVDEIHKFHPSPKNYSGEIKALGSPGYDKWVLARDKYVNPIQMLTTEFITILWLSSSGFISKRNQDLENCSKLAILLRNLKVKFTIQVRVHPQNANVWKKLDSHDWPEIQILSHEGEILLGFEQEQLFINQVFEADFVIGINTSAMLEAILLGRKVYALKDASTSDYQDGTIHFRQLHLLPHEIFEYLTIEEISQRIGNKLYSKMKMPQNIMQKVDQIFLNIDFQNSLSSSQTWVDYISSNIEKLIYYKEKRIYKILLQSMLWLAPKSKNKISKKYRPPTRPTVNTERKELTKQLKSIHSENTWDANENPTVYNVFHEYLEIAKKNRRKSINFFGDSIFYRISNYDDNQDNLMELIQGKCTNAGFFVGSAHDIRLHRRVAEIEQSNISFDANIFEINLRSFSPCWYSNPNFAFSREIAHYNKIIGADPNVILSENCNQYENTLYHYLGQELKYREILKVIGDKKKQGDDLWLEREKLIMHWHYMYVLDSKHDLLAEYVRLSKIPLKTKICFVAPINFQYGEVLLGKAFSDNLRRNIEFLKDFCEHQNLRFLDFSRKLNSTFFIHEKEKTEHLNYLGRKRLVELLFGALRDDV